MLQIFPAFAFGLYTRWFHPKALLLGWIVGILTGSGMAYNTYLTSTSHKFGAVFPLGLGSLTLVGFIALYALIANLAVAAIATIAFNAANASKGTDGTTAQDYA